MKPASACAIAKRAVGLGRASLASSRQWTPSKLVSNFDQRVTQWMSWTFEVRGSSRNCFHVSSTSFSTSPKTRSVQSARSS